MVVDVEWNHVALTVNGKLPLDPWSTVVENCFCCYFTLEIFIRFFGFKPWYSCCRDPWFMFDLALVILMVLETWVLPLVELLGSGGPDMSGLSTLRLLRLLRLTRMVRFMRFFPELLTLVRGMVRAMQSVAWILLFLLIVTYVFAIIFTSQLGTPNYTRPPDLIDAEDPLAPELFSDMGSSMMSLFTHGILGDNLHYFLITLREDSIPLMWLGIVFLVLCGISLLNMLIGILCQVIADSSEEEAKAREQTDLERLLLELFQAADTNGDGAISEEEWSRVASSGRCQRLLQRLDLDERKPVADRLSELQKTIFGGIRDDDDSEELAGKKVFLDFDQFQSQVLDLRKNAGIGPFDLRRLETKVQQKDRLLGVRLAGLQADLRQILRDELPSSPGKTPTQEKLLVQEFEEPEWAVLPGTAEEPPLPERPRTPAVPNGMQPVLPGQLEEVEVQAEAPKTKREWLREVPTELLIDVLQSRVRGLSVMKIGVSWRKWALS
ncbi:Cacna1d [Symbiodinium pilosum]|uniref:Cacna1d protein n=1 Tax=Symbiodinium pilosum TaxID=2952 RepID=A0A812LDC0_SYMPI|nr:Cacna1d [Symbiodinium pilosum]